MDWSKKRSFDEEGPWDHPTYRIHSPAELTELIREIESADGL